MNYRDGQSSRGDEPKIQTTQERIEVMSEKQTKADESEESSEDEEESEDESEEESSEDTTESDDDTEEDDSVDELQKSPTKVMTRKVASQNTVSNLLQKLRINNQQNDSIDSLNTSSFAPEPQSPIVISKDLTKGCKKTFESNVQDDSLDEAGFKLHSQISSLRKSTESTSDDGKNDSDDSENSYSNLKIIPKNVGGKLESDLDNKLTSDSDDKYLSCLTDDKHSDDFDDEEEWGDTTLKSKSPSDKQHKGSNEGKNYSTL